MKDIIKNTNEHPDEELRRARSWRVPSTEIAVSMKAQAWA